MLTYKEKACGSVGENVLYIVHFKAIYAESLNDGSSGGRLWKSWGTACTRRAMNKVVCGEYGI